MFKIDSTIGRSCQLTGDVIFRGGLHVSGTVTGNLISRDDEHAQLILGVEGVVRGNVFVASARIDGTVVGDLYAEDRLELGPTARIQGNIKYSRVHIAAGAQINGRMVHRLSVSPVPEFARSVLQASAA